MNQELFISTFVMILFLMIGIILAIYLNKKS